MPHPLGLPLRMQHFRDCIAQGSHGQIYPVIMGVATRYCGGEQVSKRIMKEMSRTKRFIATVIFTVAHMRVEAEGVVNSFASKEGEPMLDPPHMLDESYSTDTLPPAPHP